MTSLAAAVVGIGLLSLVNFALMLAVIRWLRRLHEQAPRGMVARSAARLPAGAMAPEFAVTTVRGESRSLASMRGARSLIGFLSPHCTPCLLQVPEFADLAERIGGHANALAVLIGDEEEVAELRQALDPVAAVAVEARRGPVATAFSATGFPTFYLLDKDAVIVASGAAVQVVAPLVPT